MGFPIKKVPEIRHLSVSIRGKCGMINFFGQLDPRIFYKKRIFGKIKLPEITLKGGKTDDPFEYFLLEIIVAGYDFQAFDAFWIQSGQGVCVKDRHGVDQYEWFVFE